MKQLRTVVVGLGRIGWQFHLPQIARHDSFDLAAVIDSLDERRQEADAEYRVPGYTDLQSCVEDMAVDLVVLASPTPMHAEHAETAFAAGSDVFCDKPMAPDLAAACSTNYGAHLIDACLHVGRHGSLVLDEDEKCWCASYFDPKDAPGLEAQQGLTPMLRLPRGM